MLLNLFLRRASLKNFTGLPPSSNLIYFNAPLTLLTKSHSQQVSAPALNATISEQRNTALTRVHDFDIALVAMKCFGRD